jgi:hypothetical protein
VDAITWAYVEGPPGDALAALPLRRRWRPLPTPADHLGPQTSFYPVEPSIGAAAAVACPRFSGETADRRDPLASLDVRGAIQSGGRCGPSWLRRSGAPRGEKQTPADARKPAGGTSARSRLSGLAVGTASGSTMARTTPVDNHVEKARRWRPAGLSLQGPDREGEGTSASRLAWAACDVTHLLALTLPRKLTRRRDTGGRAKEKGGRSRPELQGEQQPEPWPLRRDHTHDPDRKRLITVPNDREIHMVELDHDLSRRNYRPSYSFRRVANWLACAVAVDNGPAHRQERIGALATLPAHGGRSVGTGSKQRCAGDGSAWVVTGSSQARGHWGRCSVGA